jgi:peptidoglycan/xylan/chitin deacetylase (PgdA/CDA1 family)
MIYCPALMYHRVVPSGETPDGISVTQRAFARHLDWLRRWGYQSVGAADLAAALQGERPLPRRPVILTFDDGFEDNLTDALPILREFGFTALVFAVMDLLGGRRNFGRAKGEPLLSGDQIRRMAQAGVEFGAHGLTHPHLCALAEQEARREIVESKRRLEDIVGREVAAFCYPFGEFGRREMDLARSAGYRCAFSTRRGNRHRAAERFRLSRVWTNEAMTRRRLAYRLGRAYDMISRMKRL